jgi:methylenetetrahydrofolate dehydrogenase (NADP+) / methenyltetrahydrofolate cyclohydrolase
MPRLELAALFEYSSSEGCHLCLEWSEMTKLLYGKPVADQVLNQVRARILSFVGQHYRPPRLTVVLVGEDPASIIYTRRKRDVALSLGMEQETMTLPANASPTLVQETIQSLNENPHIDGILIQRPLPKGFSEEDVLQWIDPAKDVDAFHPVHAGRLFLGLPAFRPCTPAGIMMLLDHYGINPAGRVATIVGRSSIVGKPMASLLLNANATVIQCHRQTKNLAQHTREAQILIVAAGHAGLIDESHVRQGSTVIDVGIHRTADGKIVGDVARDRIEGLVQYISPVPGGVGPMTIAFLMKNTMDAAELRMTQLSGS